MKPVGWALPVKRAGLAVAVVGLLWPGIAWSLTCGGNVVFGGDNKELDCRDKSCNFDETIAVYATVPVYGYCYDGNQKISGQLSLTDADACVSCAPQDNGEKLVCKNTGDESQHYTVTVDCP